MCAVYDEQQLQMLASGNEYVSEDDNTAEITISGDMPQYFVATAYLLDEESHLSLCVMLILQSCIQKIYRTSEIQRSMIMNRKKYFSLRKEMKKQTLQYLMTRQLRQKKELLQTS